MEGRSDPPEPFGPGKEKDRQQDHTADLAHETSDGKARIVGRLCGDRIARRAAACRGTPERAPVKAPSSRRPGEAPQEKDIEHSEECRFLLRIHTK